MRCPYCDHDRLSSHYHCGNCGEVTGMMGHWAGGPNGAFTCTRVKGWARKAIRAKQAGR